MMEVVEQGAPLKQAERALILLHGRGGTAQNILSLADAFCDEPFYVVAPQGPNQSWYPHSFMAEGNEPFLTDSIALVKEWIDHVATHIPSERIYLMGFEGACLALEVSARFAAPYGAVIVFTGGLIGPRIDETHYRGNFNKTKIFIGTSEHDPHVPLARVEESKAVLQNSAQM